MQADGADVEAAGSALLLRVLGGEGEEDEALLSGESPATSSSFDFAGDLATGRGSSRSSRSAREAQPAGALGRGTGRRFRLATASLIVGIGALAMFSGLRRSAEVSSDAPYEVQGKDAVESDDSSAASGGCEVCPVGHCDRGDKPKGPCVFFGPPIDTGAYHCRIESCSDAPKGDKMSGCWQYDGKNFYSVYKKSENCHEATTTTRSTTTVTETSTTEKTTSTATSTSTGTSTTTKSVDPEENVFEVGALEVEEDPVNDPRLAAYWDLGTCGPMGEKGDDAHSDWCGGLVYEPKCKGRVDVNMTVCNSGKAILTFVSGDDDGKNAEIWIKTCHYMYFAQYACEASTTTTTTSTVTSTTISSTTTTSVTGTSTTSTTTSSTGTTTTITSTSTSSTRTQTSTSTSTNEPGTCAEPVLGNDKDTSDCAGVKPPNGTCEVRCGPGYEGEPTNFTCVDENMIMIGEAPLCTSTTTTSSSSTSTSTTTWVTTTNDMEGNFSRRVKKFEWDIGKYGIWTKEAGFPDDCEDGFKAPKAPALATDYNGVALPNVCYKKDGPHRVYIIGDWGGVLGPHGPVPANQRSKEAFVKGVDDSAQMRVAAQMAERAKHNPPDYILNGGDNFYWAGLDTRCGLVPAYAVTPTGQFEWVFEHVYTGAGIEGKPWLGVLGNHDYGGYMFNKGWDQLIAYTWGPGGRWVMPAQYWSTKVFYPGFSIDYIFVDTNAVEAQEPHADPDHNICSKEHVKEDEGCGEMGPKTVWDCPAWFDNLWATQQPWIEKRLNASTATWQIIVTHFPPTWNQGYWMHMSREYGIDMFVTGHMHHQEIHYEDPGNFLYPTAWVISGGGGGITSEGLPHRWGIDDQYGFYEMTLSKEVIEVQGISHGGYLRSQTFIRPRQRGEVRERPGSPEEREASEKKIHEAAARHNQDRSEAIEAHEKSQKPDELVFKKK